MKTVDQYYYGSNTKNQHAATQYILDNVVHELSLDPNRRFVYVELAFFYRWWKSQNETGRNVVKSLVENGQLEFINGGWSMNDEAVTHYVDIIDQMSLGLKYVNEISRLSSRISQNVDNNSLKNMTAF